MQMSQAGERTPALRFSVQVQNDSDVLALLLYMPVLWRTKKTPGTEVKLLRSSHATINANVLLLTDISL